VVLELEQARRLPGEQLVGEALERLAQHHPAARLRVAGAEVQVGQPPLPAAVPPLDGEHHQVERVPRLDLDPARAAPPGRVGGGQRLGHHALMPPRDRVAEERVRLVRVTGHQPRHQHLGRNDAGQRRAPLHVRQVDQVGPVQVQHVEQKDRQRHHRGAGRSGLAGRPRGRVLEGVRPPVRPQRDQLPVEYRRPHRQRRQRGDDLGQPRGDVVERPREQPDGPVLAAPSAPVATTRSVPVITLRPTGNVRLYPDTVQLPLHRRNRRRVRSPPAAVAAAAVAVALPVPAIAFAIPAVAVAVAVTVAIAVTVGCGCVGDELAQRSLDGRCA
jgi:hypothetical protein